MASHPQPVMLSFLADAAIAKGKAVKFGTDSKHVAVCSANTDHAVGILQTATTAAEDVAEVALPGGGAKALCGEIWAAGNWLVPHTDGSLVKANAEGDTVLAIALSSAAVNDLAPVLVVMFTAHAAQS